MDLMVCKCLDLNVLKNYCNFVLGDFLNSGFNIDPSYIVTMIVPAVDETTTEIPTTTTTTTTTTRRTTTTTIDNSNLLKLIDFASQYGYMRLNYDKSRDIFYQTNEYYNFHSTTPSPSTVDTLLAALQTNN